MPADLVHRLRSAHAGIVEHLHRGIIPFWRDRVIDYERGGYQTHFDANGEPSPADGDKYLTTQMRLLWWFSTLARLGIDREANLSRAHHGLDFLLTRFYDREHGGFFWRVTAGGTPVDVGKVVYGQSFAIYALAEHALATQEEGSLRIAEATFEWVQTCASDNVHGGYFEQLERDGALCVRADPLELRKTLDTHMHLLEAFTVLHLASGEEVHRRKLREVRELILGRMIDRSHGCGGNQFSEQFDPLPAIALPRTFNAERDGGGVSEPFDTTSYGHNLELAWLLLRARESLGEEVAADRDVVRGLSDHALRYGFDHERGGVYREGPHAGPPLIRDKEFWQNAEALVGLLFAYEVEPNPAYLEAFVKLWSFVSRFMIHPELGEWRMLVDEMGCPLVSGLGSAWKVSYHTGRAMIESSAKLETILAALERKGEKQ